MGSTAWFYEIFPTICDKTTLFDLFIFISANTNLIKLFTIKISTIGESSLIMVCDNWCDIKNNLESNFMSLTLFLGYFAGFLTTVSLVPQVIKIWTTKSADDFSLMILLIWWTGISCWLVYGVLLNAVPIILWNVITLLLAIAILVMKLKFKDRHAEELK